MPKTAACASSCKNSAMRKERKRRGFSSAYLYRIGTSVDHRISLAYACYGRIRVWGGIYSGILTFMGTLRYTNTLFTLA